jgi:hypothetical protein
MASLVIAIVLGAVRLHRASLLTASINQGISREIRFDNALEVARRVATRFRYIEEHGAMGGVAAWPLHTDADYLLTGGDCGKLAGALGAVFVSRGRPFRIIQINVGAEGASHIMFETPDDLGRWVLLDPHDARGFPSPDTGRLLGIEEIRALPADQRQWLAEEYRNGGHDSLFGPYRRTNWARLGPLAEAVHWAAGDEWTRHTSLRVAVLRSDHWLTGVEGVAVALLAVAGFVGTGRFASLQLW